MAETPKYTLIEAKEAERKLVRIFEFAFFTALADLTDAKQAIEVGPVTGGGMEPNKDRRALIEALVDRLLYEDDLVLYPAPETQGSSTREDDPRG